LLWKIFTIWLLFEENLTRERDVMEKKNRPSASKLLHERGSIMNFYIDTAIGKLLSKIFTMLRKAMLFHLIHLVYVPIFTAIGGVKILSKMLPQSLSACILTLP
jgi:hypothetical protein